MHAPDYEHTAHGASPLYAFGCAGKWVITCWLTACAQVDNLSTMGEAAVKSTEVWFETNLRMHISEPYIPRL